MKIVTIKELHDKTGRLVRQAGTEPLVITDRGVKIAVLKNYSESELTTTVFPSRSVETLPRVQVDSTRLISEDRAE